MNIYKDKLGLGFEKRRSEGSPEEIKRDEEYRSAYMRDEARVIHSFSFRRLQGKTQILGPIHGDFHRNRMTHSLEVASISRSIVAYLKTLSSMPKNLLSGTHNDYHSLITAISLLHDIGHPPFGHAGEAALNCKMSESGGFEGNAQTLHLLTKVEDYTERFGLDLTRRALLGLIKYPGEYSKLRPTYPPKPKTNRDINLDNWEPPKCFYDEEKDIVNWILNIFDDHDKDLFFKTTTNEKNGLQKTIFKSFDCHIMDIADDIAYSIHDLEDAIHFGLIKKESFENCDDLKIFYGTGTERDEWIKNLFTTEAHKRKKILGDMINVLIKSITSRIDKKFNHILLKYHLELNEQAKKAIDFLKSTIKKEVIEHQEIQSLIIGGTITVMELFDIILTYPKKLLPDFFQDSFNEKNKYRIICDYIEPVPITKKTINSVVLG